MLVHEASKHFAETAWPSAYITLPKGSGDGGGRALFIHRLVTDSLGRHPDVLNRLPNDGRISEESN